MSNVAADNRLASEVIQMPQKVNDNNEKERGLCWNFNVADQFPVYSVKEENNSCVVTVGPPHKDYSIKTTMVNGKMNGESIILSSDGVRIATLVFDDGIANGPCALYDTSGLLYYKGRFENGLRQGKGKEYDCDENLVFEGFYEKGKRLEIYPMTEMKGYWKEVDEDNLLVRITKKNDRGQYDGICYFYSNGEISRISKWKDGKEISLLKIFNGDLMTEYKDGVKRFQGGYINDLTLDYPRNGRGEEYDRDGLVLLFKGTYLCGRRHGKGIVYRNNMIKTKRKYIWGHTKCGLFFSILGIMLLIACSYFINLLAGISVLSFICFVLFTQWSCSKVLRNKKNSVRYFEYVAKQKCQTDSVYTKNKCKMCFKTVFQTIFVNIYLSFIIILLLIILSSTALYVFVGPRDLKYKQTSYYVDSNRFNYLLKFQISNRPYLTIIEIGNNSCSTVHDFTLKGLEALGTLRIGDNSFTKYDYQYYNGNSKSFHIVNCGKLELIEIGQYSFSDFAGQFELRNVGKGSLNYHYSDMIIESMIIYYSL